MNTEEAIVESHKLTKKEATQLRAQAVHLAEYLRDAYAICTCKEKVHS
jgi:hypothetical protein